LLTLFSYPVVASNCSLSSTCDPPRPRKYSWDLKARLAPGLRYWHVGARLVRCGLLGEAILQASVPELIDRPDGAQDIALTGVVEEP
jgi:hypothetical protein